MEFYTPTEVAGKLRVSRRTIERWLISGQLKGHKLGKGRTALWRIGKKEVEVFLDNSLGTVHKKHE